MSTAGAAAPAAPRAVRELGRAALAPLLCAALLIALLAGWVAAGGAGTLARVRVQVTLARVPMAAFTQRAAAGRSIGVYLDVRNLSGQPDDLVAASSPAAGRIRLTGGSGGTLPLPAGGTLTLSPFGPDLVLVKPWPLRAGETIPLTLRFRHAASVTVAATVTAPGAP